MGKRQPIKLELIKDKEKRNVAFCKRKRYLLQKAIELSELCGKKVFIVMFDEPRKRLVQFSSEESFEIKSTYDAIKMINLPEN